MLLPLQGAWDSNTSQTQGDALGYVLLPILGASSHNYCTNHFLHITTYYIFRPFISQNNGYRPFISQTQRLSAIYQPNSTIIDHLSAIYQPNSTIIGHLSTKLNDYRPFISQTQRLSTIYRPFISQTQRLSTIYRLIAIVICLFKRWAESPISP